MLVSPSRAGDYLCNLFTELAEVFLSSAAIKSVLQICSFFVVTLQCGRQPDVTVDGRNEWQKGTRENTGILAGSIPIGGTSRQ
jgi:hypothetical protein